MDKDDTAVPPLILLSGVRPRNATVRDRGRDPLFWIVRDDDGKRSVYLQRAQDKLFAWMRSAIAGHRGGPIEIHEIDDKTAREIPKSTIGRALQLREANALLKRLA